MIDSIEVKNFRNYEMLSLKPDENTTILYGDNGQGKTNILEAVYVGSTSRSHRTNKESEMIRFGEEEAHVKMFVKRGVHSSRIDIHLKKNRSKGIAIDGIPIRKASELFGVVNVIFFAPEDLFIIKNGPADRRRFLDMELCQLDKIYVYHLIQYNKALIQRNKLLKELEFRPKLIDTLDIWDAHLANYGREVIKRRRDFVAELGSIAGPIHRQLSGERENLRLSYEESSDEEHLEQAIAAGRERDLKYHNSGIGPHRDDICFSLDGTDLRRFGSQGQQRTAALALKLAEIELVKRRIKDTPILLLDDVFSELDSNRQNRLLGELKGIQTIITCTGLDELVENRCRMDKIYYVAGGKAEEKREQNRGQ